MKPLDQGCPSCEKRPASWFCAARMRMLPFPEIRVNLFLHFKIEVANLVEKELRKVPTEYSVQFYC
jgi:hypothetical protein